MPPLTKEQKRIRRNRAIAAAITEKQEEKGKERRTQALRKETAEARATGRGKVAVETEEGFDERSPEEAQALQQQKQSEAAQQVFAESPEGQAQAERERQGVEFLERRGVLEERLPERVELDLPTGNRRVPVLGPGAQALGVALAPAETSFFANLLNLEPEELQNPLINNPENLRETALQEIQKEVIAEGLSAGERFGAIVESVPVIGGLAAKFAGNLIEDPKSNVETVLSEIDSERERASVLAEKAFTGKLGDPFLAVEQIEDIEENIIRLEQRIQLLSQSSAALRADADALNRIEEKILRSKERVFIAKQAAAGGIVAPATDSNIFLTLQELRDESS